MVTLGIPACTNSVALLTASAAVLLKNAFGVWRVPLSATSFVGWDSKVIKALLRSSKSSQAYRNGVAERFINVRLFS
jgi:hypothetical protein